MDGGSGDRDGPARRRCRPVVADGLSAFLLACLALTLGACTASAPVPPPDAAAGAPAPTLRQRVAALALRQVAFGSLSVLPVRFEHSRIAGPFEDGGRTLYCVTSRMLGRSFGRAERPRAVIRDEGGTLRALDEAEVCEGHRTEPFPELDSPGAGSG